MPSRSAIPIPDSKIRQEIENFRTQDNPVTLDIYLDTFTQWLDSSLCSQLQGLKQFGHRKFTYGTVQSFDHFYLKHKHRRFRFFKGEFMYHKASMNQGIEYCYLEEGSITSSDALIISLPFSDSGTVPVELDRILSCCDKLAVPVLIDLAYYPLSFNIDIDLRHPSIETVTASLSKAFDGAQYLRAGIRFQRKYTDDGIDIANSVGMVPANTLSTACYLMNNYTVDHNYKYISEYYKVCEELNLENTNCLMFGISKTDYEEFNRGNSWNRVCISEDIGNRYASTKS